MQCVFGYSLSGKKSNWTTLHSVCRVVYQTIMSFPLPRDCLIEENLAESPWSAYGLGPRMTAIAQLISEGTNMADIGSDHCLLPEALLCSGRVQAAVAIDRCESPLLSACSRLQKKGCEILLGSKYLSTMKQMSSALQGGQQLDIYFPNYNNISLGLRLSEGISSLSKGEFKTVVMAGFGALNMIKVLEESNAQEKSVGSLVLQPTSSLTQLRFWLARAGWRIKEENIVREGNRAFISLHAKYTGVSVQLSPLEALIGSLKDESGLLRGYMASQIEHLNRAILGPGKVQAQSLLSAATTWMNRQY